VGSALSGVAEAPSIVADDVDEDRLVAAVRRGDDRAFEALYSRYQRRIHAYVVGMVKDHGRAEDVTQEVFVSALRRMRATERPIAFKPWIYEIAKNACIDQYRRTRRTEEVSLEADEGLAPADYGKLVNSEPTPEVAVANKQDLDNLCGALGGLSDAHHEILVLREFEGLSYQEIGERMNMSRPAVESTLFRARRRLTEEFDELVTGARCLRVQSLIAAAAESRLGTRESRRLSRHISHCQPCRREAMAAGLDSAILTHVPLGRRAASKIAGLLPFPLVTRPRGGGGGDTHGASLASSSGGGGWMANLPLLSEQLAGGWGKLATAAVVLVAGAGAAGVGSQVVAAGPDTESRDRPALERKSGAGDKGSSSAKAPTLARTAEGKRAAGRAGRAAADRRKSGSAKRDAAQGPSGSSGGAGTGGGGAADTIPAITGGGAGGVVDRVTAPAGGAAPSLPNAELPTSDTTPTIEQPKLPSTPSAPSTPSLPAAPKVDPPPQLPTGGGASLPEPIKGTVEGAKGAVENAAGVDLP
jgi:RNA polymerase sigma factor (sigma-70 family)